MCLWQLKGIMRRAFLLIKISAFYCKNYDSKELCIFIQSFCSTRIFCSEWRSLATWIAQIFRFWRINRVRHRLFQSIEAQYDAIRSIDRFLTSQKLRKMNATRSRIYARLKRARRRIRSFFQTKSRKICLFEREEGNKTKRVSRVSDAASVTRCNVRLCTRVDASFLSEERERESPCFFSLSFSLVHSASYLRILGGETRA